MPLISPAQQEIAFSANLLQLYRVFDFPEALAILIKMRAIIHTPTNKLENSTGFYEKLEFKKISENPLVYTDGRAVIEINPDRFARAGIKLFKDSWVDEIARLGNTHNVIKSEEGHMLSDPSGSWIYLIEGAFPVGHVPAENSFSVLGNHAGICLETGNMAASIALYETLGFKKSDGPANASYLPMANEEGFTVTLMAPLCCPHLFFNPSIAYFNGKINNPLIIDKIRKLGIPIAEEITVFNTEGMVDNIIVRDPGGFGFFVYND